MAIVLVKFREGADPPFSLADHEEKTHVAGKTFGLPSCCEGRVGEKVTSISCRTDRFTCFSPFKDPRNDRLAAVMATLADFDRLFEAIVVTGALVVTVALDTLRDGLTLLANAGSADGETASNFISE